MAREPLGPGRTMVVVAAVVAVAGFFLPWVLVLYDMPDVVPPIHVFVLVLDSSGYDLAFGRLAAGSFGDREEVAGNATYLAFLAIPAACALVALGHWLLRSTDRRLSPAVVGILALAAAGFLLERMYFHLADTVGFEIRKRFTEERAEESEESFQIVEENAVPRLEIGFWLALFGFAGTLSGSFLWYRDPHPMRGTESRGPP